MKLSNNLSIDALLDMYADQGFDTFQLKQIEEGLEQGLDVSIYAKKIHSVYLMKLARTLLAAGADLESCVVGDKLNRNKLLTVHQYYLRMKKVKGLNYHELRLLQMYPYKREK
jgi:hypothetical protein